MFDKIKDEKHAAELREQHLESIRAKGAAEVAHAKEVAAKMKTEKYLYFIYLFCFVLFVHCSFEVSSFDLM